MKLISTTDFVLEQKRPKPCADTPEADYYYQEYVALENICNYANFLKQKLELWMFVPCDEDGRILIEPNPDKFTMDNIQSFDIFREQLFYYKQAKERVLFDGFKYNKTLHEVKSYIPYCCLDELFFKNKKIEYLVKYNLTLTETAIKKIGL